MGISGNGGDPPKGTITAELIVKFFYGEFTNKGFQRYSGFWKGPPPGTIGKKDIKVGYQKMKDFFANPNMQFISKGGIGFGVDETLKVEDDGKGYIWLAAEMSPGGLALETFRASVLSSVRRRIMFRSYSTRSTGTSWTNGSTLPWVALRSSSGKLRTQSVRLVHTRSSNLYLNPMPFLYDMK